MIPYAATTVQDVTNAGGCATSAVFGLSKQIVDEVNCLVPNALAAIPARPNLVESSTTFAFLQPPARDDLLKALDANTGMTMNVESILRTVAQQYLLYAWYKAGMCGIQLAATPGTSNHEQGLAFDTADYSAWQNILDSGGFKWFGSSDVVHFDYVGSGAVDLSGKDVAAFQTLWNLNNPATRSRRTARTDRRRKLASRSLLRPASRRARRVGRRPPTEARRRRQTPEATRRRGARATPRVSLRATHPVRIRARTPETPCLREATRAAARRPTRGRPTTSRRAARGAPVRQEHVAWEVPPEERSASRSWWAC